MGKSVCLPLHFFTKGKTMAKRKIEDFEVEGAVSTLMRAEEIKSDAAMMKRVKGEITKKKKAVDKLANQTRGRKKK